MSLLNRIVGAFTFEETAAPFINLTGRGGDITNSGGTPHVTGRTGFGFSAEGTSQQGISTSPDFKFGARDAFSLSIDVAPDFGQSSRGQIDICGYASSISEISWELFLIQITGSWLYVFRVYTAAGNVSVGSAGFAAFTFGRWDNVRIVRDPDAGTISISVNCAAPVVEAFDDDLKQLGGTFYVGAGSSGIGAGSYDNLYLWERALTVAECGPLCAGTPYPWGICGIVQFGDYEFPNSFWQEDDGLDWSFPMAQLARADGGRSQTPYVKPRRLAVKGGIVAVGPIPTPGVTDMGTALDTLLAALGAQPQDLFYGDVNWKYRDVRVESFHNPYGPTMPCRFGPDMSIVFMARDPFRYNILPSSDTWTGPTSAATHAVTCGGAVFALPHLTFVIPSSGPQIIGWKLENLTTGETITLAGTVTGGDSIVVDSREQTVEEAGGDSMSLFAGSWITLAVGVNSLKYTRISGSVDPSSIGLIWQVRKW